MFVLFEEFHAVFYLPHVTSQDNCRTRMSALRAALVLLCFWRPSRQIMRTSQLYCSIDINALLKGTALYSAVSSPLDRSKTSTRHPPSDLFIPTPNSLGSIHPCTKTVHSYISTAGYSQILLYTAESTGASWS